MTTSFAPAVTGLAISGGNIVTTLADGTTSIASLPTTSSASASTTSYAANTLTTSYPRPLTDVTGEAVHVVSFIPAGTAISAVTDWGPIWNAALAECRAIVAAGGQFRLVGPGLKSYVVATTINMTDLGGGNGDTPFGSGVDFNHATILGQTGGAAVIDAMNTWFLRISNLSLNGSTASGKIPTIGFQHGRAITNSNADTLLFENVFINGWFSLTAYYNLASESLSFLSGWISNSCPVSSATGVVSVGNNTTGVAPTPVSGAANICYVAILDGLNHWQVPTLSKLPSQTGNVPFPPETTVSFEQPTFINVTFSNTGGPTLWMSHCASPRFIRCYVNTGGGASQIDIYRIQNDDFVSADFDIHFETFGSTPNTCVFRLIGPAAQFYFAGGFAYADSGSYATTSVFHLAGSQASPTVLMEGVEIRVPKVVNGSTNATNTTPLFDTPAAYTTAGDILCGAGAYNGVNHTGRLNLDGVVSEVGNFVFSGILGPASTSAALANLGLTVSSVGVGGITITNPTNHDYYTNAATGAYTVTVTISPPPAGGTQATAQVTTLTPINSDVGVVAGGSGYPASATTTCTVQDANGTVVTGMTVQVVASSSGAVTDVYPVATPLARNVIPASPLKAISPSTGSGCTFNPGFRVTGIAMLSNGSGYQNASSPPTVTIGSSPSNTDYYPNPAYAVPVMAASFSIVAGQKIYLDAAGTMWVEEDTSGKVVIGTGSTRLFSIDRSGNVVAMGTITASGTP